MHERRARTPPGWTRATQRKNLISNAAFCQQAYDGEDVNGNNALDPGEDLNGNGILDHYRLPQPPKPPKVRAEVESQNAVIYWDKSSAELSLDPISRKYDFEGYRIYRSNAGADFTDPSNLLLNLPLVGEFDRKDDNIGYNTGFGSILLDQPKKFAGDTVQYWYRFPPAGIGGEPSERLAVCVRSCCVRPGGLRHGSDFAAEQDGACARRARHAAG